MTALDVETIEARLRERGIANYDEEVALVERVRELEALVDAMRESLAVWSTARGVAP